MNLMGLLFAGMGAFAILGAACDWDWFMNSRKARFMVKILTRDGARLFYSILGLALVVIGVLGATGMIDMLE